MQTRLEKPMLELAAIISAFIKAGSVIWRGISNK
jgi:hypothetical protein